MTVTELLIPPSPVDWRLYDHEVMMGWKTAEQVQQLANDQLALLEFRRSYLVPPPDAGADAFTKHAKKYLGLSKIPGLVETLTDELKADRHKKVVLFFETRDVGMALRERLKKDFKAVLLFKNTPDSQRAKRLKDFATKGWCRAMIAALPFMAQQHDLAATEGWFVELSPEPEINAACSRHLIMSQSQRLVLLQGTVDETLMRQRWAATAALLEGVTV